MSVAHELRILCLEDNPVDAELVEQTLRAGGLGCEFARVETRGDFVAALDGPRFDVILADNTLPGYSGREALALARERWPQVPFIFVSGTLGEDLAVEMLKSGASDYVLKTNLSRLIPSLRRSLSDAAEHRKRQDLEKTLEVSRQRYSAIFTANPLPIALTRISDNHFVDVNQAWQDLTGYAREEVVGRPPATFGLWAEPAQRQRMVEMIQERGTAQIEARIRTKRGEPRDVLMSGEIVALEGENHLLTSAVDLTERKAMEERLAYQSILLDNVTDAIVAVDRTFAVRYWNRAAEKLYGWKAAEIVGGKLAEFIRPVYLEESRRDVMRKIARDGFWNGELLHNRRDGSIFPVEVTISEVRDTQRRVCGHVAINHDITNRKRTERDLRILNAELARSNADLEEFGYSVSHDLQEPVRLVESFAGLLENRYAELLGRDGRDFLGFVREGAERMRQMIDGLLEFSRVSTRGGALGPVPLGEPLEDALKNLALTLEESGGTVVHDELPAVLGDRVQLALLFQNLIGNALKFRKPGEPPRVVIGARQEDPASTVWTVSVLDNGIGIETKFLERIFLVFKRLHSSAEYPGTGIGLAICRKIVERHGGQIRVESTPGQGSTFFFTLQDADSGVSPPLRSLPVMQLGFDRYLEVMYDRPDLFRALMAANEEFCVAFANAQLAAGATAVCCFDPVSSPTIVPRELYLKTGFEVARRMRPATSRAFGASAHGKPTSRKPRARMASLSGSAIAGRLLRSSSWTGSGSPSTRSSPRRKPASGSWPGSCPSAPAARRSATTPASGIRGEIHAGPHRRDFYARHLPRLHQEAVPGARAAVNECRRLAIILLSWGGVRREHEHSSARSGVPRQGEPGG